MAFSSRAIWELMRWDKPVGGFLLMWPALWGLWLASNGHPPFYLTVIFVLGTWMMRPAGCIINDWVDAPFDRFVARTQQRPLASGRLSRKFAALLLFVLLSLAAGMTYCLKWPTVGWALIGLSLTLIYPWMKRWTHLPQVVLGLAFSVSILMAFSELSDSVWQAQAWILFLANTLWVMAYDTAYARMDREDDLKLGLKSTAILFGSLDIPFILLFEALMGISLLEVGWACHLHWPYFVMLLLTLPLFFYQFSCMKSTQRPIQWISFSVHNAIGALIFLGLFFGR